MDSGNSASMQSSSGGGDEVDFDSRGGGGGESSFSSFLNINNFTSSINNPQLNILTHQNPSTTFFDPQNNFSNNNNENNNLIWSTRGGLRSEPIYPSFNTHHQSIAAAATTTTTESVGPYPGPSSSVQLQPTHAGSDLHRNNNSLSNVIKNPKKRTRASRRAPTTVLTTDTTNFRQMVQEFTGIPAAPFTGNNTSSYSRRLDLYSAASALRSGAYLDSLGPLYPLRPAKGIMDSSTTTRMNVFGGAAATSSSSNNINNANNNYNQGQLPLMNLQQQQQQGQEESGNPIPMNFGNLMSGTSFHHHGQEINNGGGVDQENFDDGNIINNNRSSEQHLVVRNLNINSDKNNEGNVASWNYPST